MKGKKTSSEHIVSETSYDNDMEDNAILTLTHNTRQCWLLLLSLIWWCALRPNGPFGQSDVCNNTHSHLSCLTHETGSRLHSTGEIISQFLHHLSVIIHRVRR